MNLEMVGTVCQIGGRMHVIHIGSLLNCQSAADSRHQLYLLTHGTCGMPIPTLAVYEYLLYFGGRCRGFGSQSYQ